MDSEIYPSAKTLLITCLRTLIERIFMKTHVQNKRKHARGSSFAYALPWQVTIKDLQTCTNVCKCAIFYVHSATCHTGVINHKKHCTCVPNEVSGD